MRRLSSPRALIDIKQTAPAPTGLHSTRQKLALLIALPPSLSRSRMAGFSPATRTLGAGGFGAAERAAGSCACIIPAASRAIANTLEYILCPFLKRDVKGKLKFSRHIRIRQVLGWRTEIRNIQQKIVGSIIRVIEEIKHVHHRSHHEALVESEVFGKAQIQLIKRQTMEGIARKTLPRFNGGRTIPLTQIFRGN